MNSGACNCCQLAICDAPTLVCDSISVSKSKCGFQLFSGLGQAYTDRDFNWCAGTFVNSNPVSSGKYYLTYDETDTGCGGCAGTGTITFHKERDPTVSCLVNSVDSCSGSYTCFGSTYNCGNILTSPPFENHQVISLTDEYLTDDLIANAIAALPAYPETYAGTCSAFRNLSTDESSITIRRIKWKLRHYPTASCYLKVWLRTRFRPEGTSGASDDLTDLEPYVWDGTPTDGLICFTDKTKPHDHADNLIESDGTEQTEPDEDGTLYVEIKKWSCLDGYEPDNPEDDGSRPDPDVNPNGWPPPEEPAP